MDSLPQYTPEQIAEKHRVAKELIDAMIKKHDLKIQTHEVDGQTLYCVYDWFSALADDGPIDLPDWPDTVILFAINETPISLSTVLLPYQCEGHSNIQLEFGPALALVYLKNIEEEFEPETWTADRVAKAMMSRQSYIIPEPRKPLPIPKGYLYIVHIDGTDEYKIGYTENFQRRLGQYKMHTPPSVLWVVDYLHKADLPKDVEKSIHRIFDNQRVSGEWFRFTKAQLLNAKAALAILQGAADAWRDREGVEKRIEQFYRDAGELNDESGA